MTVDEIKWIDFVLRGLYLNNSFDVPSNHEQILEFVINDIKETADPVDWNNEDIRIAFRRFIESKANNLD